MPQVEEAFIDLLSHDDDPSIRSQIAFSLWGRDDLRAISALESALADPEPEVREAAILSLTPVANLDTMNKMKPLLSDSDLGVRQTAIASLGSRLDDFPQMLEHLTPGLNDSSLRIQATTISALGANIDELPELRGTCLDAMNDSSRDFSIRQSAMLSLSGTDETEMKDVLIDYLFNPDWRMRHTATAGLSNFSDADIALFLRPLTQDSFWPVRQQTALSLANFDQPQVADYLAPLFQDSVWQVRQAAVDSAGRFDAPETIDVLASGLEDPYWQVRQSAVFSLNNFPDEQIVGPLRPLLYDEHWQVRQTAIGALAPRVATAPELVQPLANIMDDDPDSFMRQTVMFSLGEVDQPQIIESLRGNLTSGDWRLRSSAAWALGSAESPAAIAPLSLALQDNHYLVRSASALALGPKIDQHPELVGSFRPLLEDTHWQVRQAVVQALGSSEHPEVVELLAPELDDLAWQVRQQAALSLANFDQPQVVDYLAPLTQDDHWQVRQAAVDSLGRFDVPEIDALLTPILDDPSVSVRQTAALGLGTRVGDNPQLVELLVDVLQHESDLWTRQIAAMSLRTVDTPEIKNVESLIQQAVPEVKVVVIIPGIELPEFKDGKLVIGRDASTDWSKDLPLRKILELGGVKVIEHRWTGNLIGEDFREAQLGLDRTMNSALDIARGENVLVLPCSGGNLVAERLFEHLKPAVPTPITEAIQQERIRLINLNSPSLRDFSRIDPECISVSSFRDPISWPAVLTNLEMRYIQHFPFGPFSILPGTHSSVYFQFSQFHSAYQDPRVISNIVDRAFPQLTMPQLDKLVREQDVANWVYFPTHGFWPGTYDFTITAPENYYFQQQYYPQPAVPMPVQAIPIDTWRYTPTFGDWPGQYDFIIRAPDNYYLYQQQFYPRPEINIPEITVPQEVR